MDRLIGARLFKPQAARDAVACDDRPLKDVEANSGLI